MAWFVTAVHTGVRSLKGRDFFYFREEKNRAFVSRSTFVNRKHDARANLGECGIVIIDDAFWKMIVEAVSDVAVFVPTPLVEHTGWTGQYFADRTGCVYSPKGEPSARATFPRRQGNVKGTFGYWEANVARPLTGQHLPMLAVMAALAAPLLEVIGEAQNIGFEFWGPAQTGKTTCLRIAASVAGDPTRILNFNATHAGFERVFADHRDLPLPVDEANLISHDVQFQKDFAFRMANGTMKLTAHTADPDRSHFVFITTSNSPFYASLRGVDPLSADAALQRLIPIGVNQDGPYGVFEHLPGGFANSGALANHISAAIARSHGRLMPRFIKAMVNARANDAVAFKEAILARVRMFEQAIGIADTRQGKSRVSSAIGLLYAAGEFARASDLLPSAWDCLAACMACYRNYQAQLPQQVPVDVRLLAIAQRPETLDLRNGSLPELSDDDVDLHGAFLIRSVGGRRELLLTDAVLRSYFPDWSAIKHDWKREGLVIYDPGHDRAQRRIRSNRRRERLYCFVVASGVAALIDAPRGAIVKTRSVKNTRAKDSRRKKRKNDIGECYSLTH